jgi:N-acetylglucosamine-6-phosphate deacetylase
MDRAVANFQRFTGVHTLDAARLSSSNPAIMLDQIDLIRIAPGSPANFVHLDAHGNLLATYINGERIPASPR